MGAAAGPDIADSGLVLALDAADINSFDEYENIITNSEFVYTQQSGSTVATANQLFVPYGRTTAVNFNNNGGAGDTYIYRNFNTSLASGTKYVISVFSNSPTLVLGQGGLAAGKFTQISSGSITLSNGWYRHWVSYSATVNNPNITPQVLVAQGINVTLSGWQVETGTEITEYYPTAGTAKTRGSTWIDLMGNGNNGTLTNGPTYSSANGGSIAFDGTNDYVSVPVANNPTQQITLESWINPNRVPSTGTIRGAAISGDPNHYLGIFNSIDGGATHSLHFALQTSSTRPGSQVGNIPRNVWSHIVGTYDGARMKAYLNGVMVYDVALTGTISGSGNWVVGCYYPAPTDGTHNFDGKISNAKIYNRALTAAEIQQNFNATRRRFGI